MEMSPPRAIPDRAPETLGCVFCAGAVTVRRVRCHNKKCKIEHAFTTHEGPLCYAFVAPHLLGDSDGFVRLSALEDRQIHPEHYLVGEQKST